MNENIAELNRGDLEEEYQLSQWALSWALYKLGGTMTITSAEMVEWNKTGRIWYERDRVSGDMKVEFKGLERPDEPAQSKD